MMTPLARKLTDSRRSRSSFSVRNTAYSLRLIRGAGISTAILLGDSCTSCRRDKPRVFPGNSSFLSACLSRLYGLTDVIRKSTTLLLI
jgi:hypothetical protein